MCRSTCCLSVCIHKRNFSRVLKETPSSSICKNRRINRISRYLLCQKRTYVSSDFTLLGQKFIKLIYSLIRSSKRTQAMPISYLLIFKCFDWLEAFHLDLFSSHSFQCPLRRPNNETYSGK
jgi:hypothetical protein